jgi:6,7-dimethyl-8-ribityllumazine synthase
MRAMQNDQTETPKFDKPVKLLVVVAGTDAEVNALARSGAMAALTGIQVEEISLPRVADVPQALGLAERLQEFDGYVVLGLVLGAAEGWSDVARALTGLGMGGALNGNGLIWAKDRAEALKVAEAAGSAAALSVLNLIALSRTWTTMTKGIGFRA